MKPCTSVNQAWCRLSKTQVERGFSRFQQEGRIERGIAMHMLGYRAGFTPHRNAARPALSPRRGSRFVGFLRPVFASVSQVGVTRAFNSVSPLSLWEREPIRGLFETCVRLGISGRCNSRIQLGQSSLPLGEGSRFVGFLRPVFASVSQVGVTRAFNSVSPLSLWEREPIRGLFETCVRLGISGRCNSRIQLGQFPLPSGRGLG